MPTFQPLINLIVLLTVLSVAAERVANIIKFRDPDLRNRELKEADEREREGRIQSRVVVVGIAIAIIVKADLFSILTHLDEPWSTLGWVSVTGSQWFRSPATQSIGTILYAVAGSVLTGLALGFGSKFWHDVLSTVYELRNLTRQRANGAITGTQGTEGAETPREGGGNDG